MKTIFKLAMVIPSLMTVISLKAQIKNAETVTVKIDGSCGMCKETIEAAATQKKNVKAEWNVDTKSAVITFDKTKTNTDEILKRVAYAGYDNEKFLAPDDIYAKLPGCCQYERHRKKTPVVTAENVTANTKIVATPAEQTTSVNQLKNIFNSYFELKNSLVKSDGSTATVKAAGLLDLLSKIDMTKLETDQHNVWMKLSKEIIDQTSAIVKTKDIAVQRKHFSKLSDKMYEFAKVSKLETVVYYQHCPMYNDNEGANWLSTESAIKNPYYGSQMLSCGKTVETIN